MKIMLDTNILISALVFGGEAQSHLEKLLVSNNEIWVSQYVVNEFYEKIQEKWPDKTDQLINILRRLPLHFCESTKTQMGELRDKKDIPLLSDALYHKIDVILTGDKDFLEAELEKPLIFSLKMMEEYLAGSNIN